MRTLESQVYHLLNLLFQFTSVGRVCYFSSCSRRNRSFSPGASGIQIDYSQECMGANTAEAVSDSPVSERSRWSPGAESRCQPFQKRQAVLLTTLTSVHRCIDFGSTLWKWRVHGD